MRMTMGGMEKGRGRTCSPRELAYRRASHEGSAATWGDAATTYGTSSMDDT
jgi:hypothetical protein